MRVWLDDQECRDPKGGWTVVRTADDAIDLLLTGEVTAISLDHDLEDFRQDPYPREVTGFAVVRWMVENGVFPRVVNVHSMSPQARFMAEDLARAAPHGIAVRMWKFDGGVAKELEALEQEMLEAESLLAVFHMLEDAKEHLGKCRSLLGSLRATLPGLRPPHGGSDAEGRVSRVVWLVESAIAALGEVPVPEE